MSRGRLAVLSLVLCGLLLAAIPAAASARFAYVTGSGLGGPITVPIDLATEVVGAQIPIGGGEGGPSGIAITPDGTRAYVTNTSDDTVIPIDLATNTAGTAIPVLGAGPTGIAITPDGTRAYVTDQNSDEVSVIDLATNTEVGTPIAVGDFPQGIAITPNGARAYVVNQGDDNVTVIDLASGAVVGPPIAVGNFPRGIAITPDGARAYVANVNDGSVSVIDLASGAVSTISSVGNGPFDIAIAPNGALAYVVNAFDNSAAPLDIAGGTVGAAVPVGPFPVGVAIAPDGSRAYSTNEADGSVTPINVGGGADSPISVAFPQGSVSAIAIVPNQGPRAAFSSSPTSIMPKPALRTNSSPVLLYDFNASGSTDSDGTVARYDWDFGDGTTALNAGPTPSHAFPGPGTYTVTLTVTDNEGCSTTIVFTGQTASCNGSSAARVSHQVEIAREPCVSVKATATSFEPKIRPGHTVPGLRVRLSTSAPARVKVQATMEWSRDGDTAGASLPKLSVDINRWRRLRFPIPPRLRDELSLGTPVTLKLTLQATPRNGRACAVPRKKVGPKVLHLRVVRVFPNRVQAKRPR